MQTIESQKNSYGSKRNITIIFCVVWLVLGALILEWLPLIPANDTSVPENFVTLDVTSNSLKTRGESGNIHLFIGESEYILPTGTIYDADLISEAGLEGKYYVDVDNAHVRTPVITGLGKYLGQLINMYVPGFKIPEGINKILNMVPLTTDYKIAPAKSFFAWTFNKNATFYTTTIDGKSCTVVIHKDFYWIMDGVVVKEVRGNETTVFEQRSSAVTVLSSDKVSDDGFGNVVVKKSFLNRVSLARAFGMLSPISLLICLVYLLPLVLFFRNILSDHAMHMEDLYGQYGIEAVRKESDKLETLKTVFTVIGAIWLGGYVVTMLINMFGLTDPLSQVTIDKIGNTAIQVMGATANDSLLLGIPTAIFFHVPATFADMTGYVEMFLSISSLAITACFALFPALLIGSLAKNTAKDVEHFMMRAAHERKVPHVAVINEVPDEMLPDVENPVIEE